MAYIVVFTTFPDRKIARKVSRLLVEEKLAACVQCAGIDSIYRWKGKVESAEEVLCIIKTKKSLFPSLCKRIRALHPYEVPEIVSVAVEGLSEPYRDWMQTVLEK